ncbi:MAG: ribonuclease HII [Alphaproteobacteria bacterium]|nr:ribonuclease HII [Alphaproteobacteria bacterium]
MPDFKLENACSGVIAGIDEAGRGPWAGPVVAGAVVFCNRDLPPLLANNLDDSKKLSKTKREMLYDELMKAAQSGTAVIGIGTASCREIDELNILQATFLAMRRAAEGLKVRPDIALIDGNRTPDNFICPVKTVIKGDAKSFSIAAASIVAKVYRDRIMCDLAKIYPYYGFEKNAGYGTATHIAGLKTHGITPEHRLSYKPIQAIIQKK